MSPHLIRQLESGKKKLTNKTKVLEETVTQKPEAVNSTMNCAEAQKEKRDAYVKVRQKVGGILKGDTSIEELDLEQSGDINILQRFRLHAHFDNYHDLPDTTYIPHQIIFVEEDLREIVQEEISIKKWPNLARAEAQDRLHDLNVKYWCLAQKWSHYRSCLVRGVEKRGFELWRSHPKWYMHRVLVEECASRQGCCSRGCGCCLNRTIDPSRKLGVGHCTVECGCCRQARGFDIPEKEKKLLKTQFREDISKLPAHPIARVAFWGLVGDVYKSPFDMIDVPPSYEKAVQCNNLV
ncbi:hypothetical protein N7456_008695 [Penicillium angulare]|uniref:Uncharacterized protein n=1 Tax=Penicillium angulare TaxID=116970 RepID=A0A9W9K4J9_9EURO|nr:hypothetical protein N7456_008695 [Penicillium angulare]